MFSDYDSIITVSGFYVAADESSVPFTFTEVTGVSPAS